MQTQWPAEFTLGEASILELEGDAPIKVTCPKCMEERRLGAAGRCLNCKRASNRDYYQLNRAAVLAKNYRWNQANKPRRAELARIRRAKGLQR